MLVLPVPESTASQKHRKITIAMRVGVTHAAAEEAHCVVKERLTVRLPDRFELVQDPVEIASFARERDPRWTSRRPSFAEPVHVP